MEAYKSTESADLTTGINSSSELPAVTSDITLHSQSSGRRRPTSTASTSSSFTALSATDFTSASKLGPSSSTAYTTKRSNTPSDSTSGATDSSNNNLSQAGQIAIGVVVPVLTLIAGLVFGIRAWSRKVLVRRSIRAGEASETDNNANELQLLTRQGTLPLQRQMTGGPQRQMTDSLQRQMTDTPRELEQNWI